MTDSRTIFWIYPTRTTTLDSATWIDTTRELRAIGWDVNLIVVGRGGREIYNNVEVNSISVPDIYLMRQIIFHLKVIWLLIKNWRLIDVLVLHSSSLPFILPMKLIRVLRRENRPIFLVDWRTIPMEEPRKSTWKDRLRNWFMVSTYKPAAMWADCQTANSQRMADAVGCPPEKLIGVWPAGVTLEQFSGAQSTRKWPESNSPIVIGYIGVINFERNLMGLAKAVETANQLGMNFHLLLVGNGTEREVIEEYAKGTEGRIRVVPTVPHDQIPQYLAKAHVGALPFPDEMKFRVSSPIKLFEYMGAGLPILATCIPCHTEVIKDGKYAFWAENSSVDSLVDALRQIWKARDQLPGMGQLSAEASKEHTWKMSAIAFSTALEKFLIQKGVKSIPEKDRLLFSKSK